MSSMREQIRMTADEQSAFLAGPHKMALATIGPDGMPHQVTMYYAMFDGQVGFWTYSTSQKARNLARDSRCSVLIETGEGYENLVGISIRGTVTVIEDPDEVLPIGQAVYGRYVDFDVSSGPMLDFLRDQASKRNAYLVTPSNVATWDHRKLTKAASQ